VIDLLFQALLRRLEPETAHTVAHRISDLGVKISPRLFQIGLGIFNTQVFEHPVSVSGIRFRNPLGCAAGFDKNAEWIRILATLGFGSVEVGTVTLRGQPGNSRPRLFRDFKEKSLFNRMGFNNLGSSIIRDRIIFLKERYELPEDFRIGLNIGKNKDTDLADAPSEYAELVDELYPCQPDYWVINVSSPNTEGLRQLQDEKYLLRLAEKVKNQLLHRQSKAPVFIKLAPENDWSMWANTFSRMESQGAISGLVLTNTLAGQWGKWSGGWSGGKLKEHSRRSLETVRNLTSIPIISVGGVDGPDEFRQRLDAGAKIVQVYSHFVLQGPRFPVELLRSLPLI
jgi:dihydroorotate dehydrogenase